jgi:hypothetical protein
MSFELEEFIPPAREAGTARARLPEGLVLVESAVAALRAWTESRDAFAGYEIFGVDLDVEDIEAHVAAGVRWQPLPAMSVDGGVGLSLLSDNYDGTMDSTTGGVLALPAHQIAIARWVWMDAHTGRTVTLKLAAAPSSESVARFASHVHRLARSASLASWQVFKGGYVEETPSRPALPRESVVLDDALADRLEREVIGFFAPAVADMYASLGVPHRRGVLMYGPPGNGKTTTIRYLGGRLPQVAALILRPDNSFNGDTLDSALAEWTRQAPAMLIIEDLNWVLERVNVSTFLNALDGIDTPDANGGLLLIASTNHPDRLDAALSNRPGRFDVVVEVPLPSELLRLRFLRKHLATMDEPTLARLAADSHGLSFAHLGEVLRISGLAVIAAGRTERTVGDLIDALRVVLATNESAERDFVAGPQFGLHMLVKSKA